MAKLNFSALTAPCDALTDISKLLFLEYLDPGKLGDLFNFTPGVVQGEKVGFIGQFGLMGKEAQGCEPDYSDSLLPASEKTWDVPKWGIYEKLCFTDVESTMLKYALAQGVDEADLTDSDYVNQILVPALTEAIRNAVMRFVWFGDKNVEAYSSSNTDGQLKEGIDPAYFNVTDGFFKRIADAITAGTINQVSIAANAQTTWANQLSAIRTTGVATGILDDLIESASPILRGSADGRIYVTQALADAVARDIRQNNKGSDLQWKAIFAGIKETQYNGVTVVALPFLDAMIRAYYHNGNAVLQPFRAIYTTKEQLMVGSRSQNELSDIKVVYDDITELNYMKAKGSIGTLIKQDELVSVAW